ncbi:hypothetical protein E3C22_15200 [Jiella endophytica]|uniref:Heme oxygenase n=1 Tax=Jiella endophytica TaxID=2558362 RepID=A0A4Y8RJ61_9HYPH|nr:hypothetical protein [Jiella endophytica]TFF21994.1 hypothetical protein E3C22_15200 [Jiella endophytica]
MNEISVFTTNGDAKTRGGPAADGLRSYLRSRTAKAHAQLDARFASIAARPEASDYHRFVLMNLTAYRGLSAFLAAQSIETAPDLKTSVDADLQRLETDAAAMGLDGTATADFVLAPYGPTEAAGVTYVLDGSKLGARFIHRRLEMAGMIAPRSGISTEFLGAAFDAPAMGTSSDALAAVAGAYESAAEAALATFALFERSLDRVVAARREEHLSR